MSGNNNNGILILQPQVNPEKKVLIFQQQVNPEKKVLILQQADKCGKEEEYEEVNYQLMHLN